MSEGVEQQERATQEPAARWAGPRWLWFGVLGGSIAWAVHLVAAWMIDELACVQGHGQVLGLPLRVAILLATVVPAAAAVASWIVAVRATRVLRRAEAEPPPGVAPRRIGRARFMAEIGAWADGFSLLMIAFGAVAVLTFSPCIR